MTGSWISKILQRRSQIGAIISGVRVVAARDEVRSSFFCRPAVVTFPVEQEGGGRADFFSGFLAAGLLMGCGVASAQMARRRRSRARG